MKNHKNNTKHPNKPSNNTDAWRKVSQTGNFTNWMDYQKWLLSQVKPIDKYKKGI